MATTDVDDLLTPDARWHHWVRAHPVGGPLLIGLIATQMATLIGYYLIGIGLPSLPWPLFNGLLGAPGEGYGTAGSFFVGQSIHMVDGIVFTLLYVILVWSRIPLPNTNIGNIEKGLVYGTVLAIISMGFLVPYVYAPKQGYGIFSFDTDAGWKLPLAILLWHLVYGFFVGTLFNPAGRSNRSST
jgi:hypothetical protein